MADEIISTQDKKTIAGFMAGMITGVVAALLFTPKSGQEVRSALKSQAIQLKDNVESKKNNLQDKAQSEVNRLQKVINEANQKISQIQQQGT